MTDDPCEDCGRPVRYDSRAHCYYHPDGVGCFLASAGHAVPLLEPGERVDLLDGATVDADAAGTVAIRASRDGDPFPVHRFVRPSDPVSALLENLADALDDLREG